MAFALLSALLFQFLLAMLSPDIEAMGDTLPRQGGARDPFEAVDISPRTPPKDSRDLRDFSVEELRLTAIFITTNGERRASLENGNGIGFPIHVGSEIGPEAAKVVQITPNSIILRELRADALEMREMTFKPTK
jgi:Tfp pilus assembly protein PilP